MEATFSWKREEEEEEASERVSERTPTKVKGAGNWEASEEESKKGEEKRNSPDEIQLDNDNQLEREVFGGYDPRWLYANHGKIIKQFSDLSEIIFDQLCR